MVAEHPRFGQAVCGSILSKHPGAGLRLGSGPRAAGLSSRRQGQESSPRAQARLGGGGFALFTLQLWLWLEFVKGSG